MKSSDLGRERFRLEFLTGRRGFSPADDLQSQGRSSLNVHEPSPALVRAQGAAVLVRWYQGTHVSIQQGVSFLDWMPAFHEGHFRRSIHSLADTRLIAALSAIRPGTSLFSALDLQSDEGVLVTVPTEKLPSPGSLVRLCGAWNARVESAYRFFEANDTIAE
jgi:hypothetical protein